MEIDYTRYSYTSDIAYTTSASESVGRRVYSNEEIKNATVARQVIKLMENSKLEVYAFQRKE